MSFITPEVQFLQYCAFEAASAFPIDQFLSDLSINRPLGPVETDFSWIDDWKLSAEYIYSEKASDAGANPSCLDFDQEMNQYVRAFYVKYFLEQAQDRFANVAPAHSMLVKNMLANVVVRFNENCTECQLTVDEVLPIQFHQTEEMDQLAGLMSTM